MDAPSPFRQIQRRVLWHRRKLAALCAAIAAFAALNTLKPPPPPSDVILIAARDIAAGSRLHAADITSARYPRTLIPAHSVSQSSEVIGRAAASGIPRGAPITRSGVVGEGWADLPTGIVAVAVRIQDSAIADLLKPGQRVRLHAVDPRSPDTAQLLVAEALVLAVPRVERTQTGTATGRLVVFGVPEDSANLVTSSAVSRYLTVIWGH